MKLTLYQIDAFTNKLFGGNPAAVVPLDKWIDDELMQRLGMENNLSETVFFVPSNSSSMGGGQEGAADFDIRWFTPALEINLCGHATLASAYVLFEILRFPKEEVAFNSKSGILKVKKDPAMLAGDGFRGSMDFPAWMPLPFKEYHPELPKALGNVTFVESHKYRDVLIELPDEKTVKNCQPDFNLLKKIGDKVIITARGNKVDFVSRFFAPIAGVDEDPVTGSAHSQLIPYWAGKLGKNNLHALQLSQRGGELWCGFSGERVTISGQCVFYMKGEFEI